MIRFYRALYHGLITVGRPVGGVRPRWTYDVLGRKAYPEADLQWFRDRWGQEMLLSHHFHLDRNILIYGDYDHELHLLFEKRVKAGMVVLDVGANLGEMTLHLATLVSEKGTIHAFEPLPAAFARLVMHIARHPMRARIHPHAVALSNSVGQLGMSVPAPDADNQGIGSIVNHDARRMPVTLSVEATTLDLFVQKNAIAKIDFIKLDIQGAEYFFLEGAKETLRVHRPELAMEVSPGDLRAVGKTSRDLLSLVESFGYRIHQIRRGKPTAQIMPSAVPVDFAATNILCIPR